jgi:hypothetical protein
MRRLRYLLSLTDNGDLGQKIVPMAYHLDTSFPKEKSGVAFFLIAVACP